MRERERQRETERDRVREREGGGNILFNDALTHFILQLYGITFFM